MSRLPFWRRHHDGPDEAVTEDSRRSLAEARAREVEVARAIDRYRRAADRADRRIQENRLAPAVAEAFALAARHQEKRP